MPVVQPGRYGDILNTRIRSAENAGINGDFMAKILSTIHEESVRLQVALSGKPHE